MGVAKQFSCGTNYVITFLLPEGVSGGGARSSYVPISHGNWNTDGWPDEQGENGGGDEAGARLESEAQQTYEYKCGVQLTSPNRTRPLIIIVIVSIQCGTLFPCRNSDSDTKQQEKSSSSGDSGSRQQIACKVLQ
ncbi:hypothetical protein ACLKA7_013377 [Drosophila subpalustris]